VITPGSTASGTPRWPADDHANGQLRRLGQHHLSAANTNAAIYYTLNGLLPAPIRSGTRRVEPVHNGIVSASALEPASPTALP